MSDTPTRLDDLAGGSVLAAALLDARGNVLLPAGTALTPGIVAGLQKRGIGAVVVQVGVGAAAEDPAERRARSQARLAHLFRHVRARSEVNPLMHIVPDYRLGDAS